MTAVLMEELEREPTMAELAEALDMPVDELLTLQVLSQPRQVVSFDEALENSHGEESLPLLERLADPDAPRPDESVHCDENRRILTKILGLLPKSQGTVLVLHYLQGVPLREVADLLKVTPSRVSQLHHQGLGKLRLLWKRAERQL